MCQVALQDKGYNRSKGWAHELKGMLKSALADFILYGPCFKEEYTINQPLQTISIVAFIPFVYFLGSYIKENQIWSTIDNFCC